MAELWHAAAVRQVRLARLVIEADPVGWLEVSLSLAGIYFGLIWAFAVLSPALLSPRLLAALPGWGLAGAAIGQIGGGLLGLLNLGGHTRWRMLIAAAAFLLDWALLGVLASITTISFGTAIYFALSVGSGLLLWRIRRTLERP